ncbi:3'-phosphoesterase [Patescibacteria group bacterium]|nr:3'-phosphoesterase [Patescibacteria group bacterium]
MALKKYSQKRDFSKTKEPGGYKKNKKDKLSKDQNKKRIFVIQFHQASHDHFDLRLEMGGILKSWAIPKEPPKSKGIKRLAIQVEDHPLNYANFQGTIPEGSYGAGKVEIWDKGEYILKSKNSNKIEFTLKGKKLDGDFVLIKTNYGSNPEKNWIWFKI